MDDIGNLNCPQFVDFSKDPLDVSNSSDVSSVFDMVNESNGSLMSLSSNSTEKNYSNNVIQNKENHGGNHQKKPKCTVPKPFKFETDRRVKKEPITNPKKRKAEDYVCMAEQLNAFEKSPKRFHSSKKVFEPSHWEKPTLTQAKTPNLQTVKRRRVVDALTREQQEEKEVEEMKQYHFRARPLDPQIYRSKLRSSSATKRRLSSKFNTSIAKARRNSAGKGKGYVFKARPAPKAILAGPTGLPEKAAVSVTVPQEIKFEVENRLEQRKVLEEEKRKEKKLEEKATVSRKTSTASTSKPVPFSPPKLTQMKPFSFDQADKQRFAQKEVKIQKEIEDQTKPFVFRAQLMPVVTPPNLPNVAKKPATKPMPFNFETDKIVRHEIQNASIDSLGSSFKAQPAKVLKKEPFIPVVPERFIEPDDVHLHSDVRAEERRRQKELKEAKEQELEALRLEQEAREEERRQEELARMRAELVHKAQPVRHFKPVEVKKGLIPLTEPVSPDFEVDKRLRRRHHEEE